MLKKTLMVVVVSLLIIGFVFAALPQKQGIASLLSSQANENIKVYVEGFPVLVTSASSRWGSFPFYVLKDDTGEIPVQGHTIGWNLIPDEKIGIVGTVSEVCIEAVYNETDSKLECVRKDKGIVIT
jgi:hypothetical protein